MMRTVSPVFAVFSSSCAFTRFVRVTIFPYTGCGTRRSSATTTVFCILSLTTRPTRTFRAARSPCCSDFVIWAIAYRSPAPAARFPFVVRFAEDFVARFVVRVAAAFAFRAAVLRPAVARCAADFRAPPPVVPAASRSRSRRIVFIRATSLRIRRSRSGSSSVSVAARKRSRKRSSSSSATRERTSSSLSSRISSARIGVRPLALDELGLHAELRGRQRHRLAGDLRRHALELEHHAARLHHGHPPFRRALALPHPRLGRLLRDRLVREDPDPHLAAAL